MNTLTIISLFCDKDYQYIPALLKRIDKKVICNYELILVDNREKNKDIEIPEIWEFFKTHNGELISKGENLCQLAAKKWAVSKAIGDYVWFVDGDDDLEDTVSYRILNTCKEDIIVFNYTMDNIDTDVKVYQECFITDKIIKNKKIFRTDDYLRLACPTCWNKWFRKDLLQKVFENIPNNIRVSCNEDVYIFSAMLNRSKKVHQIPVYIYTNRPDRGTSNNNIHSVERFKLILQGWQESMKLFKKEFPKDTELFIYESKKNSDTRYFLSRICCSDKEIWKDEIDLLIKVIEPSYIKNIVKQCSIECFLSDNMRDIEVASDLKIEILKILNNI